MLVKISTDKPVSEAAAALQTAVQANHFGVMQVHNLKETMTKKGVEFARECLIFEVCQPQQAKKVLDENMSVHRTALPDLHLRGGRQNHSGHFEANHSAGNVQYAATGRGGAGSGGHACQNHEGSGVRLIGRSLNFPMARFRVIIAPGCLDRSYRYR
jgi:Domain of unknown function DUF302